jgi:hypothetical protein
MAVLQAATLSFSLFASFAAAAFSNNTLSVYQTADLVNTTGTAGCLNILSSTITCYSGLPAAVSETTSWSSDALSLICEQSCTSALKSWISNVDTACGSNTKYNISRNIQTASSGGHELLWKQTASCLESSSGELCNLVIQQAAADKDTNVLCSSCALQYLTTVANSEWGQMILDPEVVSSQIDSCSATATYSVTYTASTATTSTTAPTVTSNDRCNVTDPDTITYTIQGNETCLDISASKNVSTPALRTVNNLDLGCAYLMSGQVICLPDSCETYLVRTTDTCDSITASLLRSVSTSTFRSWNPWINSACSNMNSLVGQYLCIRYSSLSQIFFAR